MNIRSVLRSIGIENIKDGMNNGWIMCSCPFAKDKHINGEDNNPSFGVNVKTGFYNCFSCHSRGYLHELLGNSKLKLTARSYFFKEENESKSKIVSKNEYNYEKFKRASEIKVAKEYLLRRGIGIEQIIRYNIRFSKVGRFKNRIIVPVFYEGKCVGIVARSIYDKIIKLNNGLLVRLGGDLNKKYLYNNGFNKSKYLWNIGEAMNNKTVYVVEGIFDAFTFIKYGYTNVVSTLGCCVSKHQITLLIKLFDEIIISFDNDRAGMEAKILLGNKLYGKGVKSYYIDLSNGKDWGDINDEIIFQRCLKNTKSFSDYRFGVLNKFCREIH